MKFKTMAILLSFGAVYSGAAYGMEPDPALEESHPYIRVLQSMSEEMQPLVRKLQSDIQNFKAAAKQFLAANEQHERENTARETFVRDQYDLMEGMSVEAQSAADVTLRYEYKAAIDESIVRNTELLQLAQLRDHYNVILLATYDEILVQVQEDNAAQLGRANSFVEKM